MVELNPKLGLSKSCNRYCNPKIRGAFHFPKFETRPDIMLLNIQIYRAPAFSHLDMPPQKKNIVKISTLDVTSKMFIG